MFFTKSKEYITPNRIIHYMFRRKNVKIICY